MRSLRESLNSTTINESVATIALGVAGALVGLGILKALLSFGIAGIAIAKGQKAKLELERIQNEMKDILEKYPEDLKSSRVFKDLISNSTFALDGRLNKDQPNSDLTIIQLNLAMSKWDKADRDKMNDLLLAARNVWSLIKLGDSDDKLLRK